MAAVHLALVIYYLFNAYGTYSNENIFKRPRRALLDLIGNANTRTELSTMWNFLNNFVIVVCGHQQEDFLLQQVRFSSNILFYFFAYRLASCYIEMQKCNLLSKHGKPVKQMSPATVGGKISTLVRFM